MGTERTSGEAWENKRHILQESHSIYIWEVDLLGREVIPGRVGYWTGEGGNSEEGVGVQKENPGHLTLLV